MFTTKRLISVCLTLVMCFSIIGVYADNDKKESLSDAVATLEKYLSAVKEGDFEAAAKLSTDERCPNRGELEDMLAEISQDPNLVVKDYEVLDNIS